MERYDSKVDTLEHIYRVAVLLMQCSEELLNRARIHDASKLTDAEKPYFDKYTPLLKISDYGSDEYKAMLKSLKPALDHHYMANPHHPEHYLTGIDGMNLFDLVEMFMDWKAATERHDSGDIFKSIDINEKRFSISIQLAQILKNTATYLGWLKQS